MVGFRVIVVVGISLGGLGCQVVGLFGLWECLGCGGVRVVGVFGLWGCSGCGSVIHDIWYL